jgi:hypothetical protein
VYFGYDDLGPQGGLNDQGLFFDGLSVFPKAPVASAQKPAFPGGPLAKIDEVMATSATVDEALAFFERYSRPELTAGQLFFGDKAGNSAIVEGDAIIRKQGSYQVATNFRQSEYSDPPYPCERANTAAERLSQAGSYSVELFRQILDATHQDHSAQTVYSQVYDLKKGLIYLYLFHDFRNGVVLNLADELAKGPHMVSVASFFPKNQAYDQWSSQQIDQWKSLYAYKIDAAVSPASLGSLVGDYRVEGGASASPVRIYLEKDQLYLQKPNELPLELYPASASTVFHRFYNNVELKLAFQRDGFGQVTGAQAKLVYSENEIIDSYILDKTGALSASFILWLALSIALVSLAVLGIPHLRRGGPGAVARDHRLHGQPPPRIPAILPRSSLSEPQLGGRLFDQRQGQRLRAVEHLRRRGRPVGPDRLQRPERPGPAGAHRRAIAPISGKLPDPRRLQRLCPLRQARLLHARRPRPQPVQDPLVYVTPPPP